MKNVATAPRDVSASRTFGVSLPGPSSNVSATHFTLAQSTGAPGGGWTPGAGAGAGLPEGLAGAADEALPDGVFAGVAEAGVVFAGVGVGVGAGSGVAAGAGAGGGADVAAGAATRWSVPEQAVTASARPTVTGSRNFEGWVTRPS
ncbi:hypothetical protein GCM10028815_12770 [Mariniluteicoccus flavus]